MSSLKLRQERVKKYERSVFYKRVIPRVNGCILTPSPVMERKNYFFKFPAMFIDVKFSPWEDDGFSKLKTNSQGYKALIRFSETNYGSSVIKQMVDNYSRYKEFKVRSSKRAGAFANYKKIILPSVFPTKLKKFKVSGQKIFDLAIIYHEFSHTMVFRNQLSKIK